ncbi:hypothetical protein ACIBL8_48040 [Streptomyces sp. NPDC050523]|uniref:hypothetical protein n=1 Tax=Streptomyces sp. NPDC050523 TaxID=3365622 RepID=UPI0037B59590
MWFTASLTATPPEDGVRPAATGVSEDWFHRLLRASGLSPPDLASWSEPTVTGGPAGVAVAHAPFTPDPIAMATACTTLAGPDHTARTVRLRAWPQQPHRRRGHPDPRRPRQPMAPPTPAKATAP